MDQFDFTYTNITDITADDENPLAINMAPYGFAKLVIVFPQSKISANVAFYQDLCMEEAMCELKSDSLRVMKNYAKIDELYEANEYAWFHFTQTCLSMVCGLHVLFNRDIVAAPVRKKQITKE